jgi:hypothetical protein
MRKALAIAMAFCLAAAPLAAAAPASAPQEQSTPAIPQEQEQQQNQEQPQLAFQPYTAEQLDNLLAPIALYPDPLLAQVLVAATFVDQIDVAARWVRAFGQSGIDDEPWDVSVKAVAHYPTVLSMMADNLDWTTAVGQAYVNQSTDVMMSIQRLREMARSQGNLLTTPQQEVIVEPQYIRIVPVGPEYIYVPYYDPGIIFFRPIYVPGFYTGWISFGTGFLIGAWLNLDCNWPLYSVYYTGWVGGGWIARCRPHVRMSHYYVDNRYHTIALNPKVARYHVNYQSLGRYHSIHRSVTYDNRLRGTTPAQRPPATRAPNKVVDRNINIYDPNLNQFRGRRPPEPAARPVPRPTAPGQPAARPSQAPAQPARPTARPAPPAQPPRTAPPPKAPTVRPPMRPAPAQRPPSAPAARPPATRPPPHTFSSGSSVFSPQAASQRGQASRSQQQARPPSSRPVPKHQFQKQGRQP